MSSWVLLLTGFAVVAEESGLAVDGVIFVVLAGVNDALEVVDGLEVAALPGEGDDKVAVTEFETALDVALVETEGVEDDSEIFEEITVDDGEPEEESVGVGGIEVWVVEIDEKPVPLLIICRYWRLSTSNPDTTDRTVMSRSIMLL